MSRIWCYPMQISELERKSIAYRRTILSIIAQAGAGHTGGSLSCTDILNVLYNHVMTCRSRQPDLAWARSLHPQQGSFRRSALRRAGRQRLFPGGEAGHDGARRLPLGRPPDAQGAGRRAEHGGAGARSLRRRRHGHRRQTGRPGDARLHADGRRRADRGVDLGGVHERGLLQARQPDRDRRSQHACRSPGARKASWRWSRSPNALPPLAMPCAQ